MNGYTRIAMNDGESGEMERLWSVKFVTDSLRPEAKGAVEAEVADMAQLKAP